MRKKLVSAILAGMLTALLLAGGCGSDKTGGSQGAKEFRVVRVGYYGGTCEAPIYVAYENGIFKKNGLTVDLIKITGSTMKEGIATGKIDAIMMSPGGFKSMEQGLNIKLTDGIHTGCIQAVVPVASQIKSIADLKGRTIGVDTTGGPPMVYLGMELLKNGINPKNEVNWRTYPGPQLSLAMEKKEIDAFSTWDPFPQIAINEGKARVLFSNTHSEPYADQLCCYVGINGKVVSDEPEIAKALTKSFAEATGWVGTHPKEAAQISIDKKYTGGDVALNSALLADYRWISDPVKARQSYIYFLNGMKQLQFLDAATEVEALVKHSFVELKQ